MYLFFIKTLNDFIYITNTDMFVNALNVPHHKMFIKLRDIVKSIKEVKLNFK